MLERNQTDKKEDSQQSKEDKTRGERKETHS